MESKSISGVNSMCLTGVVHVLLHMEVTPETDLDSGLHEIQGFPYFWLCICFG